MCLVINESDPTCLIWWRLFFYRYFTFVAGASVSGMKFLLLLNMIYVLQILILTLIENNLGPSSCGYFAHRILNHNNANLIEQLKKRLNYMIIYYKEEIKKQPSMFCINIHIYSL